ncbi:PaaI family thioesterase [Pseudonocardiaceae bacterium YIM PH 21723]|nr:PaaI family thioesterase [Pseudonocardiaceae bacterium YIM PH 21723]
MHALGIELAELSDGRSVFTLRPSHSTANAMFVVHGGVLTTLLDTAISAAVFTQLPDGTGFTGLDVKVNFVRPVGLDDDALRCEATTIHVGRKTAIGEGRITSAEGKLVAQATSTCMLFPLG